MVIVQGVNHGIATHSVVFATATCSAVFATATAIMTVVVQVHLGCASHVCVGYVHLGCQISGDNRGKGNKVKKYPEFAFSLVASCE